jgi:hypothetical protein
MNKIIARGMMPLVFLLGYGASAIGGFARVVEPPPLKSIKVTQPASGAAYAAGRSIAIKWISMGQVGDLVRILLVPEIEPAAVRVIAASAANDGAFTWAAAVAYPGQVRIEVRTPDGSVSGRSGLFTISPAGGGSPAGDSRFYRLNQVFHNTYAGEQFTPIKDLASFVIEPGTRMTVRLSLGAVPAGFGFATRAHFPGSGCGASEVRINGNCYPFSPGADPAVREQVFSPQWIAENGQVCQLKLYVYGTMPAGDYQVSGSVQVTLAR